MAEGALPERTHPVAVPAGALGNHGPMLLLPEQNVMTESDAAEALTGDPFALLPAHELAGLRGIHRLDTPPAIEIVTLHFAADEIIYADGGALVLAAAAVPGSATVDFMSGAMALPYTVLGGGAARRLVAALAEEDAQTWQAKPAAA